MRERERENERPRSLSFPFRLPFACQNTMADDETVRSIALAALPASAASIISRIEGEVREPGRVGFEAARHGCRFVNIFLFPSQQSVVKKKKLRSRSFSSARRRTAPPSSTPPARRSPSTSSARAVSTPCASRLTSRTRIGSTAGFAGAMPRLATSATRSRRSNGSPASCGGTSKCWTWSAACAP